MNFETTAIRTQTERSHNQEHSAPIYLTSSFTFDSAEDARAAFANETEANIYSRYSNPNTDELALKVAQLEGSEDGLTTATGMSAIFTTLAGLLKSGDHILSCQSIFGSTHQLFTQVFPKWNISHSYVKIEEQDQWESAIQSNTKVLYLETPSNPALDLIDLEKAGELAKKTSIIIDC